MAQEIIAIKIISGEELLGKVKSEDDTTITLSDVLGLMAQQTATGVQIGLAPFMMSNPEGDLSVEKSAIVVRTTPSTDLERGYIERTSTIDLTSRLPGQ
jgi:hypothetical protein